MAPHEGSEYTNFDKSLLTCLSRSAAVDYEPKQESVSDMDSILTRRKNIYLIQ